MSGKNLTYGNPNWVKVLLVVELVWLFFRHLANSKDSGGRRWCGPWLVDGWWHIIWRGTEICIRWWCSCAAIVRPTSWAAVQTKRTVSMEKLRHLENSHSALGASSYVCWRNRTACKYYSSSFVGRTSRRNGVIAISGIPTWISKNIGTTVTMMYGSTTLSC